MTKHVEHFLTRYYEMDRDGLIRLPCLCNYMEEAAGLHAHQLGLGLEHMAQDNLAWVLAKMRLKVHKRPGSGQKVVLETWPVGIERIQFRRDFILYDLKGQILATAVTHWVVMGLKTRRVENFPASIMALVPEDPPLAQENANIRIPALRDGQPGPFFPIRLADIDQNHHVNNGRYVDFVLEAAHQAGHNKVPTQVDLIFRAEGLHGQIIGTTTGQEKGASGTLIHSLYRESDGQELVRARTIHSS